MQDIEIKVTHKLRVDLVENLLDCAGRGARYWASGTDVLEYEKNTKALMAGTASFTIVDNEDDEKKHVLDRAKVIAGLQLMAESSPRDMEDVLEGNEDDNTGDTFLQYALLGNVLYS